MSENLLKDLYEQFVQMHSAEKLLKGGQMSEVDSRLPGQSMWLTEDEKQFHDNLAKLCFPEVSKVVVTGTIGPVPRDAVESAVHPTLTLKKQPETEESNGNQFVVSADFTEDYKKKFFANACEKNPLFDSFYTLSTHHTHYSPPFPQALYNSYKATVVDLIDSNIKHRLHIDEKHNTPDLSKIYPDLNKFQVESAVVMTRINVYRMMLESFVGIADKAFAHIMKEKNPFDYLTEFVKTVVHDAVVSKFKQYTKAMYFTYLQTPDTPEYKEAKFEFTSTIGSNEYEFGLGCTFNTKDNAGAVAYEIVAFASVIHALNRPQVLSLEYYNAFMPMVKDDGSGEVDMSLNPHTYLVAFETYFPELHLAIENVAETISNIMKPGPFFTDVRTEANREEKLCTLRKAIANRIAMRLYVMDTDSENYKRISECAKEYSMRQSAMKRKVCHSCLPSIDHKAHTYAYLFRLGRMAALDSVRKLKYEGPDEA